MTTPIDNWFKLKRGYRFGVKTSYNDFHLGLDVSAPVGTPVIAPADGKIIFSANGEQGGNTLWYEFGNYVMRVLHLRELPLINSYIKGQVIGYTGNTGMSTGPHAHIDISHKPFDLNNKNNFIDPELFFNTMKQKILILRQTDVKDGIDKTKEFVKVNTNGELILDVTFKNINKVFKLQNIQTPEGLRKMVYPDDVATEFESGYDIVCYAFNPADYSEVLTPTSTTIQYKGAYIIQLPILPVSDSEWIRMFFCHELLHAWYAKLKHAGINVVDNVHTTDYSVIIKSLQPYFNNLITNTMIFYKEPGNPAIYQKGADGKYYPINSGETFKRLYGEFSENQIQELAEVKPKAERLGLVI